MHDWKYRLHLMPWARGQEYTADGFAVALKPCTCCGLAIVLDMNTDKMTHSVSSYKCNCMFVCVAFLHVFHNDEDRLAAVLMGSSLPFACSTGRSPLS